MPLNNPVLLPATVVGDLNTLVPSNLYSKEWDTIFNGSNVVPSRPGMLPFTDVNGQASADSTILNRRQNANSGSRKGEAYVVPAGSTSLRMEMEAMLVAGTSGHTIVAALYDVNGSVLISSVAAVLGASMAEFACTDAAPVAGTEYRAVVSVNNTGIGTTSQAIGQVKTVRVRPVGASGVFGADFYRLPVNAHWLFDNRIADTLSRRPNYSPLSRYVFHTDARSITVEYIRTYLFATIDPLVMVNGKPYGVIPLAGSNALSHATMSLPVGMKVVEIIMSQQNTGATYPTLTNNSGGFIRAVYVPAVSQTFVAQPQNSEQVLVVYGDSIPSAFGCTYTGLGSVVTTARQSFPGAIGAECWGTRSLAEDCASGAIGAAVDDPVKRAAFVRKIAKWQPTVLWMAMGKNDSAGGYWTDANAFETCYTLLLADLVRVLPGCRIFCQTPLLSATEGTLPAYRTAITNAVATQRAAIADSVAPVVDGTTILTSTTTGPANLFFDTVHPNENGCAIHAEFIRNTVGW